jgi:hypothetical protein
MEQAGQIVGESDLTESQGEIFGNLRGMKGLEGDFPA